MSVKIRLARQGKKNDPVYRVVAIDESSKREGEALETLGFWHPKSKQLEIKKQAVEAWHKKGATITPAVTKLLEQK